VAQSTSLSATRCRVARLHPADASPCSEFMITTSSLRHLFWTTLALVPLTNCGFTAEAGGDWFPFPLSSVKPGAPGLVDVSFLNEMPAGKQGFVKVVGAHFQDGAGQRLRFFGTNVVATACFPQKVDAPNIAAHLAKLGHNILRMHFLDNQWGADSLLNRPDYTTYNEDAFDRLHFFLHELNKVGIYINLNIHVGRTYAGSPKSGPEMSKGIDLIYPPYSDAFQAYARKLLTTKNPYSGKAPFEDPGVAVVELNNENTLLMNPWWLGKLADPFAKEIRAQWNDWLIKQYKDSATLTKAYGITDGKLGPNLVPVQPQVEAAGEAWGREDRNDAHSTLTSLSEGGVRWEILQPGPNPWSHHFNLTDLKLPVGTRVSLSLEARSEAPRTLEITYMLNEGSYAIAGLSHKASLTKDWQTVQVNFTALGDDTSKKRLTFDGLNAPGVIELRNVKVQTIPPGYLQAGQSLETKTVPFPDRDAPEVVRRDVFEFLAATEIAWALKQKQFLRDELHVPQPIAHSHVLFGGLLGARREMLVSDFIDNHGYWEHPDFPNKAWDMNDWNIKNTSQLANPSGGTLTELAMQRPAGKPYCVSEYDIPAPNDYSAESLPMLATFACQQDWDAIYTFTYANDVKALAAEKIHSFFDQAGNPAKEGLIPAAALIFRKGLVAKHQPEHRQEFTEEQLFQDCTSSNGELWGAWRRLWKSAAAADGKLAIGMRTSVTILPKGQRPKGMGMEGNGLVPTTWEPEKRKFQVTTEQLLIAQGQISGESSFGGISLSVPPLSGNGHGTVVLVSMDGKPLTQSKKMLLTALRRAENTGQQWNATRTSVGTNWGRSPALVQGLSAKLTFPDADIIVTPLTSGGQPGKPLPPSKTVDISPNQKTIWHLLTR
jgi:hypothetical protein